MMIEMKGVCKRYNGKPALEQLDLSVREGEFFCLLGGNGEGKTTLLRILTGYLEADEGEAVVGGVDIIRNPYKVKKVVGYVPAEFGLYDDLRVIDYMEYFASIYGLTGEAQRKRCRFLLEFVHLEESLESRVDALSVDGKQRLSLARCLIHEPKLLVLDEFMSGVDDRSRQELKELLNDIHEEGKTIVLTSNIFAELVGLHPTLGVIKSGKMILRGTWQKISEQLNDANPLELQVADGREAAVAVLKESQAVTNISIDGEMIIAGFTGDSQEQVRLLQEIVTRGVSVVSFQRRKSDLEESFLQLIG